MVVNDALNIELEPVKAIQNMTIKGFVPEFVIYGSNTLQIKMDGKRINSVQVENMFEVVIPLAKGAGEKFQLAIEPETFVSPFELKLNEDKTPFSFVFVSLTFE